MTKLTLASRTRKNDAIETFYDTEISLAKNYNLHELRDILASKLSSHLGYASNTRLIFHLLANLKNRTYTLCIVERNNESILTHIPEEIEIEI